MEKKEKSKRGFASMSYEQRRSIASQGGKAAHAKGTAHQYTSETGRAAALKVRTNSKAKDAA